MNWGQIRPTVLDKLDGPDRLLESEYLPRMIQAANEGLALLATAGLPIWKRVRMRAEEEPLYLPQALPGFWRLETVARVQGEQVAPTLDYRREGSFLWLKEGEYDIAYCALEEPIDQRTPDSHVFELEEDALTLLPLYIASQLYKHDNAPLAVLWRNEFEAGRELLQLRERERRGRPGWAEFEARPF